MHKARTSLHPRNRLRQTIGALLLGLLASCQGEDGSGPPSVCPTCIPQTGGDSGDFPGETMGSELAACTMTLEHVPVTDAEAVALGYDAVEIRRRLARTIDAPLVWREDQLHGGQPAKGYQAETRIEATVTATGFVSVRNDPRYCDGTTCRLPATGESVPQDACVPYLEVPITVSFKTLDGAVSGTAKGQALRWGKKDENRVEADWFAADAWVDLHDVVGSLQLFPSDADRVHKGYLAVWLQLYADQTTGDLRPVVKAFTPGEIRQGYEPLVGRFPPAEDLGVPTVSTDPALEGDAALPMIDAGVRRARSTSGQ